MKNKPLYQHVCMPVLSMVVLVYFRLMNRNATYIIHYEIFPRYIRGLKKIFEFKTKTIEKFLSKITFLYFEKIEHGEKINGYEDIRIKSYMQIVDICEALIPSINADPYFHILETLLGRKEATAVSLRFLSHFELRQYFFPMVLCYNTFCDGNNIMYVLCPAYWSAQIKKIIKKNLRYSNIIFYELPLIFKIFNNIFILLSILFIFFRYVLKHGIQNNLVMDTSKKVMLEYIDPECFGKNVYDQDLCIDGININEEDVLFYLTDYQLAHLKTYGYNKKFLIDHAKDNKYKLVILSELRSSFNFFTKLIIISGKIFSTLIKNRESIVINLFPRIFL